jgi:hypothetical protein
MRLDGFEGGLIARADQPRGRLLRRQIGGEPDHPRLVAKDRAAAEAGGRIDRRRRHAMASRGQFESSASMNVELPTPGAPVIPTRIAMPAGGRAAISARALSR